MRSYAAVSAQNMHGYHEVMCIHEVSQTDNSWEEEQQSISER